MILSLDGIILSLQRHGSITVYFRPLLAVLTSQIETSAQLSLESPMQQNVDNLPGGLPTTTRAARRLNRFRLYRVPASATVFQSSCYSLPDQRTAPSVVTAHDLMYKHVRRGPLRWTHVQQKHAAIRAAQAVICISEATRQNHFKWVGETQSQAIHVIHNGVASQFHPFAQVSDTL